MTYFEPIELETTAAGLALRVTNILVTFGRRSTTRCSVVVSDGLVTHHWSECVDEGELDVNDSFDNGGGNVAFPSQARGNVAFPSQELTRCCQEDGCPG